MRAQARSAGRLMKIILTIAASFTAVVAVFTLTTEPVNTAAKQRVVRLRNAFIDKYKNRATVQNVAFTVDHVKKDVNGVSSGGKDGDLHMSGRPSEEIGLPMVAELVNAGLGRKEHFNTVQQQIFKRARSFDEQAKTIKISGVWRLWFEHPADEVLIQAKTVPIPDDTNPDHIFEIHPVTKFDGMDDGTAFVPIKGYTAYNATTAFGAYEKLDFQVKRNTAFTTITGTKVGYNYAAFNVSLAGAPRRIEDGDATFVLGNILNKAGSPVTSAPRRLVIVDDTAAAETFAKGHHKKGDKMKILGIPRVNLDILSAKAAESLGQTVTVKGAYEMIVVGVFPDK
jgi:hypothetical protein